MRLSIAVAVAGCLICGAAPALAQTHPTSGVFVHGGVFASIERLPHIDTELARTPFADPSGTVVGGTFGVGGFLTPRLTARLEVALPAELEDEDEETVGPIRASGQSEILLRDVYVMLGYETDPGRRIRLSYLAGAVVRQRRIEREASITVQPPVIPPLPIIPPVIQRFEESVVSYETSLALGLDAAAMMTERLALVPQVRVVVAGGSLSFRPGVSVRWTF
jgi:hypothetical protein